MDSEDSLTSKEKTTDAEINAKETEETPKFDESTVEGLEKKKKYFIDKIIVLNKKIKNKELQMKAIEEALKLEKGPDLRTLKKKLNNLEFKLSTQAHTPKQEKSYIKLMEHLESQMESAKKIQKLKHKIVLIKQDIQEYKNEIAKIDLLLKDLRNKIAQLREKERKEKELKNRQEKKQKEVKVIYSENIEPAEFTLMDLAIVEEDKKSKKSKKKEQS
ncbi:MAG: hypothetical protein N3E37_02160 [Candidatus Micrarchaeota archaeon]|nr:hypothetical protein [Candidatus Micrarchaeota archaeon]